MRGFVEELLYQKYPFVPMGAPINILILSMDAPWVKPLWLHSAWLSLSEGEMIEKYLSQEFGAWSVFIPVCSSCFGD